MKLLRNEYATKNFKWRELECKCGKGCGLNGIGQARYIQDEALQKIQKLRELIGPISLSSVSRCPKHNQVVGGVPLSMHRSTITRPTRAFDVIIGRYNKHDIIHAAEEAGFMGIGVNYRTFVHVDNRPRRARW